MRLLKSNPLLSLANSYVIDSPQPSSLSYMWNFGSLLALCLGMQIVTRSARCDALQPIS